MHERVAQQLLGHADSRTTREIYTHVSERMMDHAVQAISDAVDRVVGEADMERLFVKRQVEVASSLVGGRGAVRGGELLGVVGTARAKVQPTTVLSG